MKASGAIDSGGYVTIVANRLQKLHFNACTEATPGPRQLASSVLEWQVRSNLDIFSDALKVYSHLPGESKFQEYHRLASEAWEKVPVRHSSTDNEAY